MRQLLLALTVPVALLGCDSPADIATADQAAARDALRQSDPGPVCTDSQYVFETVENIIGDYFKINHEEPVRQLGTSPNRGPHRDLSQSRGDDF